MEADKKNRSEVFDEMANFYDAVDGDLTLPRSWVEGYIFKMIREEKNSSDELHRIWEDLRAFSLYHGYESYRTLARMPWWEYSAALRWISEHFAADEYKLTLENASRLLGNLRYFYAYLVEQGWLQETEELYKAIDYICSGQHLRLVRHYPFTGRESWVTVANPDLKQPLHFYMLEYWITILYLSFNESWDLLLEAAEQVPQSPMKTVLIKNFINKLSLLNYNSPQRLIIHDMPSEHLEDARKWFNGSTRSPRATKSSNFSQATGTAAWLGKENAGTAYVFKVSLGKARRWIQTSGEHSLLDLHNAIQEAFGFADDHLYCFFMSGKAWKNPSYNSPYDEEGPFVNKVRIKNLSLVMGQKFLYLFDFGDEWQFKIQVESIENSPTVPIKPVVVKSQGFAPSQY